MALTEQDIAWLARLSGLQLSADDQQRAQQELTRILGLIQELQAVDTHGTPRVRSPSRNWITCARVGSSTAMLPGWTARLPIVWRPDSSSTTWLGVSRSSIKFAERLDLSRR